MTRSNRTLNRILLALVGLGLLAAAAVLIVGLLPAAGIEPGVEIAIPRAIEAPVLWTVAVGAAVLALLALAWILTRGRGGTRTAVTRGDLAIDVHVVEELLRDALSSDPDVVAVSASGHRLRGSTAVRLRIDARRGADLVRLRDRLRRAVDDLDGALGTRIPLLVHITTGLRVRLAREQRAA